MEWLISSFLSSSVKTDVELVNRLYKEINFRNRLQLEMFLHTILTPLDVDADRQRAFFQELIYQCEEIERLRNKKECLLTNKQMKKVVEAQFFYVNIIERTLNPKAIECDQYMIDSHQYKKVKDFKKSWYIAIRALCLTIISSNWHSKITQLSNVPLSILVGMKKSNLTCCSFYMDTVILKQSEFVVTEIVNSSFARDLEKIKIDRKQRMELFDVEKLKEESQTALELGKRKLTKAGIIPYTCVELVDQTEVNGDYNNISKQTIDSMIIMYTYTKLVFTAYRDELNDNYGFNYLSNVNFVFSYVLMYLFRRGMFEYHTEKEIPLLYLNNKNAFNKIKEISDDIRNALEKSTLQTLVKKEDLAYFDTEKAYNKLTSSKKYTDDNKWQSVNISVGNVDQLRYYLTKNCMVLELEYLSKFMMFRNSKDYILVKFEEMLNCLELEITLKSLIKEEPAIEIPTDPYLIIKMFDNEICMVIYQPLLHLMREVSYAHVYTNNNRSVLSLPMYPNYLNMLYMTNQLFEKKEPNMELSKMCSSSADISVRCVMKIVVSWVTARTKRSGPVLRVDDSLFGIYDKFTDIVSRWESPGLLIDALNYGYRQYGKNETSILSALYSFIALRDMHFIENDILVIVNTIFESKKERIKKYFPDLYRFYTTLYKSNRNSDALMHPMSISTKKMKTLWTDIEEQDKSVIPWVYTYLLCTSNILTNSEARTILCGMRVADLNSPDLVEGREYHEALSTILSTYFNTFGKPYNCKYNAMRNPKEDVVSGKCKSSLVCFLFRSLEWASLHEEKDRGYMYENKNDLLGPTNVDPYDLLHTPSQFPVSLENNSLKYSDESLFIKKYKRSFLSEEDKLMFNTILIHYKYVVKGLADCTFLPYISPSKNISENEQFYRAIHKCAVCYAKKTERETYILNNTINFKQVLTPSFFQYIKDAEEMRKQQKINPKRPQKFQLSRLQEILKVN